MEKEEIIKKIRAINQTNVAISVKPVLQDLVEYSEENGTETILDFNGAPLPIVNKVVSLPNKLSEYDNDMEFITDTVLDKITFKDQDLPITNKTVNIPNKLSQYENDAEFVGAQVVDTKIQDWSIKNVSTIEQLRTTVGTPGQKINLLGYYEAGDKPELLYKWKSGDFEDDGGSIINSVGGSWEVILKDVVHDTMFGLSQEDEYVLKYLFSLSSKTIKFTKDKIYEVGGKIQVTGSNLNIEGNQVVIKQKNMSGMITDPDKSLFEVLGSHVKVDSIVFDDNIENNYIISQGLTIHAGSGVGDLSRYGHDVVVTKNNDIEVTNCYIKGASWTGIKVTRKTDGEISKRVLIKNNRIEQTYRDSISVMHCEDVLIENNSVKSSIHHAIHVYTNTNRVTVSKNRVENDFNEFYDWYTGINKEAFEKGGLIIDHVSYPQKTKNTIITGNVVESFNQGFNFGIATQGYPESVEVADNYIYNCTTGILITRGNPTSKGITVKNNIIKGGNNGITVTPASTANVGGKDTKQDSYVNISNNIIDVSTIPIQTRGTANLVVQFYNKYDLVIENNIIKKSLEEVFRNNLNFNEVKYGDSQINISFINNTIEDVDYKITNLNNSNKIQKGNSYIYIDVNQRFRNNQVRVKSTVANKFYKVLSFSLKAYNILSGEVYIQDCRRILDCCTVNMFLKPSDFISSKTLQSTLRQSNNNNVSEQFKGLNEQNVFFNVTQTGEDYIYELWVQSKINDSSLYVDFSRLYADEKMANESIKYFDLAEPEDSIPTGSDIYKIHPERLSNNPSDHVTDTTVQNIQQISATTLEEAVIAINTVINNMNTINTNYKDKINEILTTERNSGQRRKK